ncbi:AAA family ATPase [Candidatus Protochlamydia sp. W-9]|uniref:AAA family ATPase n=1 Tax=Candidatus Protochlamydia sp. W-9 TaxID=1785087 RepID=UPI00096A28A7|nr:AAA family ATPase [Candidatus Protochlamydia sp. W-9]
MNSTDSSLFPQEILYRIWAFLGPKDLCQCEQVSKLWNGHILTPFTNSATGKETSLWNELYRKIFASDSENQRLYSKENYKESVCDEKKIACELWLNSETIISSESENQRLYSKEDSKELVWDGKKIACDLWLDSKTIISSEKVKAVNAAALYLYHEGFELDGAKADGDCFFHAFLNSYKTLPGQNIALLNEQSDKISYLRKTLASQYERSPLGSENKNRVEEIKQGGNWIVAMDEGDLLARALDIPIRILTVNQDQSVCGLNDMLTFKQGDETIRQVWQEIPEEKKNKTYIFIVDLGGHFVSAKKALNSSLPQASTLSFQKKVPATPTQSSGHSHIINEDKFSKPGYLSELKVKENATYQNLPGGFKWKAIPMFSVIAGKNGVGKSNLLQAILFGCLDNQHMISISNNNFQICSLQNTDQLKTLRVDVENKSKGELNAELEKLFQDLSKYAVNKLLQRESDTSSAQPLFDEVIESALQEMDKKDSNSFSFSSFDRELKRQFNKRNTPHIADYSSILQAANLIFDKLLDKMLSETKDKQESVKRIFAEINNYLVKCNFKYILSEKDFVWDINNAQFNNINLTFANTAPWMKYPLTVPLSNISSGERIVLLVLLWRFDQRNIQKESVILLDEPDAHLHPSMVKEVIDVIKTKLVTELGIQVIMTTHNPTTVSFVPKKSLFILENEPPDFNPTIKPVANKRQAMNILSGNLVYVNEPFAVVFVEGDKDKQFYSILAKRLNDTRKVESQMIFKVHGSGNRDDLSSCGVIKSLIKKVAGQSSEPLSPFVFGLIDGDNRNLDIKDPRNLKALKRYSLENYILDPIHLFLCLNFIRENFSTDSDLQPHVKDCMEKFTALVSSLPLAEESIEKQMSDPNFCQQIINIFYNRVREECEKALSCRDQNFKVLAKLIQTQIDVCEAILENKEPSGKLVDTIKRIKKNPGKVLLFFKEFLESLQKEFEQVIEKTNCDIFNIAGNLYFDEKNINLFGKNPDKEAVVKTLKSFFEDRKESADKKYKGDWVKLVNCLGQRDTKIMNESNIIDWDSTEKEDVHLILKNQIITEHELQYPKFLLYFRGHNLQTCYEKILKIPHELINDFVCILDMMQSILIPNDLLEIYSSMKAIVEEKEIESKAEENSGTIPFFAKVKNDIAKDKQRKEEKLKHKQAAEDKEKEGINEDVFENFLFGSADDFEDS